MKILQMISENFKRLSVVQITPEGHLVQITGANAEGKTSVLDSIWAVLGGKDAAPDQPIRKGKKTARIEVKLGDANGTVYIAERTFTEKDSYIKVTDGQGAKHTKPQQILDGLMGTIGFDPLQFMRMESEKQFKMLRSTVKLDVDIDALDRRRATLYETRTGVNRDAKSARARADAITVPDDLPDEEPNIQRITDTLTSASDYNRRVTEAVALQQRSAENVQAAERAVTEAEAALHRARAYLGESQAKHKHVMHETTPIPELIDATAVRTELDAANLIAEGFRKQREKIEASAAVSTIERQAAELTGQIEMIDADKKAALENAKMPVDGLGFAEGVVLFHGIPLAQASAAEQLRVSAAIGAALNPVLRVLVVRDGSLLDSKSLALLGSFAEENDLQVWLERVDESGEVGVVMVDGHVKGQEAEVEAFEKAELERESGATEASEPPKLDPVRQKRAEDYLDKKIGRAHV